jgi:hypothetical protein
MANKKLSAYVTFNHPDGNRSETFGPGDTLPDWVDTSGLDASLLEGGGEDSDADLPVAGPGQVAGEGLSEDEKAEARKKADRERKAAARAAEKKMADDAAAVKAAQDAEARRQAEADAAAGQGS